MITYPEDRPTVIHHTHHEGADHQTNGSSTSQLLVPPRLVIESVLGSMFTYTAGQKRDVGRTLPGHERILLAIRARRPNAARLAARRLLDGTA